MGYCFSFNTYRIAGFIAARSWSLSISSVRGCSLAKGQLKSSIDI